MLLHSSVEGDGIFFVAVAFSETNEWLGDEVGVGMRDLCLGDTGADALPR